MSPRRLVFALAFALFALPALACGNGTPTAKPSGGAVSTASSATSSGPTSSAPTSTQKPTNTATAVPTQVAAKLYGLNELVSVKNWDLAIQKVETPGMELVWSQFDNRSTAAGVWFVVVVDMKNTGSQNFGVNTFDFELKVGDNTYKVSDDLSAYAYSEFKGGQRIGGQVPPGVNVTYYVVFDIAPGATDLQFTFKQDKKPVFAVGSISTGGVSTSGAPNTAAPSSAPQPTTAPAAPATGGQVFGLNQLVSVKNWDIAVQKVEKPGKNLVWSQFGNSSTAAGTWFVVVVDMKNTGNQNFGVNAFDFELKSGSTTYKVSDDFGTYGYSEFKGGQRVGGQVPPGVSVTYYIVFDVAPSATDLQFTFKQDKKPVFAVGNPTP